VACAGRPRGGTGRQTLSPVEAELYARLLMAADTRQADASLFDRALRGRAPGLRRAAALTIGQVKATELTGRLRGMLRTPDTASAAGAAFALGLLRDSASVRDLATALDASPAVATQAAWSLGEIGAPARQAIEGALARPHSASATAALLRAAAKLRPVPVAAVAPHLASEDTAVQRAAAYAIARPRAAAGVRALLARARSTDPLVRSYVARGLAMSAAGDSLADSAAAALAVLATDGSPHVRINAVASFGTFGPRARRPVLAAVHDRDPNVRVAAAQSLAGVLGAQRRDWAALWDADTAFMFRRTLVASAVRAGVILEAIDEDNPDNWQRVTDWRYRAAVADAAVGTPVERVREVSLPLTRDRDGRVRAAAYAAFAPFADSSDAAAHPWRRELLLKALRDEDFFVRATALAALAPRASAAEVPAALASFRQAEGDSSNDARVAAVAFVAAAWRNDSAAFPDSVRAAIAALPAPADPLVRSAAGRTSPFSGWARGPSPGRSLDWYRAVVRDVVVPSLAGRPPGAEIVTERGTMVVELFGADAPLTVHNFLTLARQGFYRDTRFHRIVPNFVAQDGDSRGDGNGGPGYTIRDELNPRTYDRGAIGMALSGPDTGGSQYFITHSPQPHLDGHYTVFGRVGAGGDVLDRLVQGDRVLEVRAP
jgi:cyclophilin family peptidyl-prolyl cis-trans isomerase/HEAT repeat protein